MKKTLILAIFSMLTTTAAYAQQGKMFINNYSSQYLEGVLHAAPISGGCYPLVASSYGITDLIVNPSSSVNYDKYTNANAPSTNFPLNSWWVKTSATNPLTERMIVPPHPIYNSLVTNTKWIGFFFVDRDANFNYNCENYLGLPTYQACFLTGGGDYQTYLNNSSCLESEFFTIGDDTYVQVY